jgi:soluble lytic murein transglycosylase
MANEIFIVFRWLTGTPFNRSSGTELGSFDLALIRQESLFDAQARSPAFALGLIALAINRAQVAKQVGLEPPPTRSCSNRKSIYLGTVSGISSCTIPIIGSKIAAYNAGEAAVDRWEKEIVTDDIEEFVERIPYIETRGYVKLVMRNHRIYKKLYATQR